MKCSYQMDSQHRRQPSLEVRKGARRWWRLSEQVWAVTNDRRRPWFLRCSAHSSPDCGHTCGGRLVYLMPVMLLSFLGNALSVGGSRSRSRRPPYQVGLLMSVLFCPFPCLQASWVPLLLSCRPIESKHQLPLCSCRRAGAAPLPRPQRARPPPASGLHSSGAGWEPGQAAAFPPVTCGGPWRRKPLSYKTRPSRTEK